MARQCEICGKFHYRVYDARELAETLNLTPRDNSTNGPDKFTICIDCYNDIERALANAWLTPIKD